MAAQAAHVTGAIQGIAAVAEEQSASSEEVAASAQELTGQVQAMSSQAQSLAVTDAHLRSLVARFTVDAAATVPQGMIVPLRRAA
jgi:methyl-accepting chemotaxis protein